MLRYSSPNSVTYPITKPGSAVMFAGLMSVRSGRITWIKSYSPTYETRAHHHYKLLAFFRKCGLLENQPAQEIQGIDLQPGEAPLKAKTSKYISNLKLRK